MWWMDRVRVQRSLDRRSLHAQQTPTAQRYRSRLKRAPVARPVDLSFLSIIYADFIVR